VSEHFDFEVIPSDDPTVREADRGFLTEVAWTVTSPQGAKSSGIKRVIVPSTASDPVSLGLLYEPTPMTPAPSGTILDGGTL